jgi:antitoxin YefM
MGPAGTSGVFQPAAKPAAAANITITSPLTNAALVLDCLARSLWLILVQLFEQVGNVMKVVTYSHARNALKSVLDDVLQDADVTIISRRDAEGDVVVMSLNYYNSIMETLHLLSTPANAQALARAIQQDRAGQSQARELLASD